MGEVRHALLRALLWAVAAEFLLVRLLSRVGVYIPKAGFALDLYRWAVLLGEVAFNLSLALALLVLVLGVWERRRLRLVLLLLLPAGLWLGPVAGAGALLAALLLMGAAALRQGELSERVGLALVLTAQALHYLSAGLQRLWGELALPGAMPGAAWLPLLSELAALLAPLALAAPLAAAGPGRGPSPGRWAVAGGAALLLAAALWAQPDLTGVLATFSLGFHLAWPAPLYVLALGAALLALGGGRRLGLALLFLAGLGLNVNQQQLVLLAGWTMLALPEAPGEEVGLR